MKKYLLLFVLMISVIVHAEEENALIVTDNGIEMLQWDLDFVREAQQSIEISIVYWGGSIAREILTTIEKRLSEVPGLQVYILGSPFLLETEDRAIIERIKSHHPENFHLEFSSTIALVWPDVSGTDNHVKMFIVDEKYFSCGGTNLDDSCCSEGTSTPEKNYNKAKEIADHLPAGMRDQDMVGRGPLAKALRHQFYQYYALWENYNRTGIFEKNPEKFAHATRYFPVTHQAKVERFDRAENRRRVSADKIRLVFGGPHQQQSEITKEYLRLIQEAQEEIVIANMYFCPVDPIFNALLDAVNRGVKITLLTNGVGETAPAYTQYFCWANRIHYLPLLYGRRFLLWDAWHIASLPVKNTQIFEYHVKDILLHKKMMLVDSKTSVVGSYNLGYRSDMGDYELVAIIDSESLVADFKKVHARDLKHSRQISNHEAQEWYFDPIKVSLGQFQKRFHGLL